MKNVLITGINGFVGSHLLNELITYDYKVFGVGQEKQSHQNLNNYYSVDLNNNDAVNKINFSSLDYVIHLAGLAAVGPSFENPIQYLNTNLDIQINLFEACLKQNSFPTFLIISSGSLYNPDQKLPLDEKGLIEASSPYAVSKIGQEELAKYYRKRGFKCIIARPFNHIGPGQGLGFIASDLAHQIFDNLKNKKNELLVGNLEAKRDYTDVRDIVRGYRLLIEKGLDGETYNLCSGKSYSGKSLLDKMLNFEKLNFKLVKDPLKYRSLDIKNIYGSYKKINQATGWEPLFDINQSIKDILSYWKNLV